MDTKIIMDLFNRVEEKIDETRKDVSEIKTDVALLKKDMEDLKNKKTGIDFSFLSNPIVLRVGLFAVAGLLLVFGGVNVFPHLVNFLP